MTDHGVSSTAPSWRSSQDTWLFQTDANGPNTTQGSADKHMMRKSATFTQRHIPERQAISNTQNAFALPYNTHISHKKFLRESLGRGRAVGVD